MFALYYIASSIAIRMQSSKVTTLFSSLVSITAPPPPTTSPNDISSITHAIGLVQGDIVIIATTLAVLMISIAGFMIILDREAATTKRGERLAFIRSILIGYGIILGANLLISIMTQVTSGISNHATPTVPTVPVSP